MQMREFEFPVGWGIIAGVKWGEESGIPVLCVHGSQDNAGSFERLIPHLPPRFLWIAIDLPGHGKSTPFEAGHIIEFTHLVQTVKKVVDHLKLTKFYVMGHSLGAQILMTYASLYPEQIIKAIFLDGLIPVTTPEEHYVKTLRKRFHDFSLLEASTQQKNPSYYSFEDLVKRFIESRPTPIIPEAARTLIKRSLVRSENGFRYSTDQRIKLLPLSLITLSQCGVIIQSIERPCLLILSEDSVNRIKASRGGKYHSHEVLDAVFKLPAITAKITPGYHDVHMNDPESVAALIIPFLNETQSSL